MTSSLDNSIILYCDGSEYSRKKVTQNLSNKFPNLLVSESAEQGLELFYKHTPNVLIVDINLPGISGLELCKIIRDAGFTIPIIVVSSFIDKKYIKQAVDLRVNKYLIKPLQCDELEQKLVEILHEKERKVVEEDELEEAFEKARIHQYLQTYLTKGSDIAGLRSIDIPKRDISGDMNLAIHTEDSIYILLADGAGHGLSAIMPVIQFPTIFIDLARKKYSLLTIANELNKEVTKNKQSGYFVAATLIQINQAEKYVEIVNCGNPSVLLIDEQDGQIYSFASKSLAFGVLNSEEFDISPERHNYDAAMKLYTFSDGVLDTLVKGGLYSNYDEFYSSFAISSDIDRFNFIQVELHKAKAKHSVDDITFLELKIDPDKFECNEKKETEKKKTHLTEKLLNTQLDIVCIEPDSDVSREIAITASKITGYITSYTTLEQAYLNQDTKSAPDIIIINLAHLYHHLPIYQDLLQRYGREHIHIIALCETSNVVMLDKLAPLNVEYFLTKPISKQVLHATIEKIQNSLSNEIRCSLDRSIFSHSSLAMTVTDLSGSIIQVNDAFCLFTEYKREELLGRNPRIFHSGKHDKQFYDLMWKEIRDTGRWSGEIWNRKKNGELYLEWITIDTVYDLEGTAIGYCSVFADITARKQVEQKLEMLSYYDELTHLPNRRCFKEKIQQELERATKLNSKLAVLFLDIDDFKDINDSFGHDVGDDFLREIAKRLRGTLTENDLLARLGGDEFVICIKDFMTSACIDRVIDGIFSEVIAPLKVKKQTLYPSISIGVSVFPDDGDTIPDLLKSADHAMFHAKKKGKNCQAYYDSVMHDQVLEKLSMVHDLRCAIDKNEFKVFYQPIVNLKENKIYKVEALIRWDHPKRGLVSPIDFIPAAEESGLIIEIGSWVFKQAIAQAKEWRETLDPDFQISVNLSPRQLNIDRNLNPVNEMMSSLEGYDPDSVIIEITEGVLMDENTANAKQLFSFRDTGMQVALDDFGTGFSSLAYIKKFDIDYIKIDRMFVKNIHKNKDDRAICNAIIALAKALDLKVIAEGIETQEQCDFFAKSGCDYAQGYYFSKPVSHLEFEAFYQQSKLDFNDQKESHSLKNRK